MVPGEDHRLFDDLFPLDIKILNLQIEKFCKYFHPAISWQDCLPKVSRFISMFVGRIASAIVIAYIKGEEFGICSIEFCGHEHFININGKMYQRPFFKL